MWKTQQNDFSRQIEQKLSAQDFLSSFEDTLSGLLDTEVMFLLTTFANMAIARDYDVSRSFITTVVSELISIGFVNDLTSGSCGKGCRDLISNIARKHPALLSYLMEKFSKECNLVENSVRKLCIHHLTQRSCPKRWVLPIFDLECPPLRSTYTTYKGIPIS